MSLKFGVHDVIVLFLFATMGFHIARLGFFGPQRSCYKGSLLYYAIKYFYRTIMIFFSTQIFMHHYVYVQKHMSMYIFLFMHKNSGGDYFMRGVNISL